MGGLCFRVVPADAPPQPFIAIPVPTGKRAGNHRFRPVVISIVDQPLKNSAFGSRLWSIRSAGPRPPERRPIPSHEMTGTRSGRLAGRSRPTPRTRSARQSAYMRTAVASRADRGRSARAGRRRRTRPSRSSSAARPSSRTASRTPRPQDGPAFIRSRKVAGSNGPSGPCRRNTPTSASDAQKTPSATTMTCSRRSHLSGGASGLSDGGCSVGVCMGSFRLVGSPHPKAPPMPARKRAGNAWLWGIMVSSAQLKTQCMLCLILHVPTRWHASCLDHVGEQTP